MTQNVKLTPDNIIRLTAAIKHVGTAEFPAHFCAFCAGLAGADAAYLTAFFDADGPAEIYSTRSDPDTLEALALYLDVAFVLDPFYKLFQAKTGDRVDGLGDIAPDDFRRSEYYAKFFRAVKLRDECGVMLHLTDQAALFLSLGVRGTSRLQVLRLRACLPAIGALARRHWTVLTPDRVDGTGRLAAHLDRAFEAFGSSTLSPREGQIARMILQGHSSKSIAISFDNSPETIKVHRKRIYAKLGVASQGELLSLFLTALRRMPATATGDPLAYLDATQT
ncbi:transcriptional regulator, LuxR family [Aliiroseovarius sediminilitoris]|uniref:Transcriptional regulator, LuxR family n=1 Tax=Aliiroseovarius sediminilitoris TaxID=1173584 RepID=A0A1I0QHF2_9RHOB|nr:helix-turn-helix transcriptional regulator [Aliiroseovarius sediminilitoris]SEW26504.1 transcriptional regulator, LuxR family [Aliiroseovarius sediminilitoris]